MTTITETRRATPLANGETVRVHYNLNRGDWVISQHGKVIAYADSVVLSNATARYSPKLCSDIHSGAQKHRAVCARFEGRLMLEQSSVDGSTEITFNPRRSVFFHTRDGAQVSGAAMIIFAANHKAYGFNLTRESI